MLGRFYWTVFEQDDASTLSTDDRVTIVVVGSRYFHRTIASTCQGSERLWVLVLKSRVLLICSTVIAQSRLLLVLLVPRELVDLVKLVRTRWRLPIANGTLPIKKLKLRILIHLTHLAAIRSLVEVIILVRQVHVHVLQKMAVLRVRLREALLE